MQRPSASCNGELVCRYNREDHDITAIAHGRVLSEHRRQDTTSCRTLQQCTEC